MLPSYAESCIYGLHCCRNLSSNTLRKAWGMCFARQEHLRRWHLSPVWSTGHYLRQLVSVEPPLLLCCQYPSVNPLLLALSSSYPHILLAKLLDAAPLRFSVVLLRVGRYPVNTEHEQKALSESVRCALELPTLKPLGFFSVFSITEFFSVLIKWQSQGVVSSKWWSYRKLLCKSSLPHRFMELYIEFLHIIYLRCFTSLLHLLTPAAFRVLFFTVHFYNFLFFPCGKTKHFIAGGTLNMNHYMQCNLKLGWVGAGVGGCRNVIKTHLWETPSGPSAFVHRLEYSEMATLIKNTRK